jgi:hypothetical protein
VEPGLRFAAQKVVDAVPSLVERDHRSLALLRGTGRRGRLALSQPRHDAGQHVATLAALQRFGVKAQCLEPLGQRLAMRRVHPLERTGQQGRGAAGEQLLHVFHRRRWHSSGSLVVVEEFLH